MPYRHPNVKVKELDVQVELWKENQNQRNKFGKHTNYSTKPWNFRSYLEGEYR